MGEPDKTAKTAPPDSAPLGLAPGFTAFSDIGAGNSVVAAGPMMSVTPSVDRPQIVLDRARPGLFGFSGPWTLDAVKVELYGDLAGFAPPLEPANLPQVGWQRELAFVPMYLREPYRSQYFQILAGAKPATPPVVVPPDLEAALIGELELRVTGAASLARRQRLLAMARAVGTPYREVLLDRLAHPLRGDRLADLFTMRLAPPTQATILAALRGEVVALPVDDSEIAQFAATLNDGCLHVDPAPAVIGPWMGQVQVVVSPRSDQAMPVIARPLELRWTLFDGQHQVVDTATGHWLPGLAEGDGFAESFTAGGTFSIQLVVLDTGLVLTTLTAAITVQAFEREADVKAGLVPPSATSAVAAMSDRQIKDELRTTQEKLAALVPADGAVTDEHATLVIAETALEGAVAARALELPPLVAKDVKRTVYLGGAMAEVVGGLGDLGTEPVVTPDPVYARIQLEQVTATHGWETAKGLVDYIETAGQGNPFGNQEIGDLLREMLPIYRAQLAILDAERQKLIADFDARAKELTLEVLRQSEERAGDAVMRYGIERPPLIAGEHYVPYTVDNNEFTRELARVALELADRQREVHTLTARAADLKNEAMVAQPVPDTSLAGPAEMTDFAATPQLEVFQEVAQLLAQAIEDYQEQRAVDEAKYPILALAKNAKGDDLDLAKLDRLASGQTDEIARVIARKVDLVFKNVARARHDLESGDLNVWRESEIVAMTKLKMQLAEGSIRARWIDEHVEAEQPGFLEKYGLGLIGLILSIVAAIPTGGASLVAGAAGVAAFSIDTYLALKAIDEYELKTAMAGSDYDKARALSKSEPSLFWLAVQLVGTVAGAGAGIKSAGQLTKAFARISQARRAVLVASNAELVIADIANLRTVARDVDLGEQATERLVRETADELPHEVAEAAGVTSNAERAAAEAATAHEVETVADRGNAVVRAADDAEVARVAAPRRPVPVAQRRAQLLAERGTEAERLAQRPAKWTGAKEAEWRGYPEPPEGNEWYWKGDDLALRLEAGGREANLTRYHYDGVGFVEIESDAVARARYHSRETWEIPPEQRQRLDRLARSRQRSQAIKNMERERPLTLDDSAAIDTAAQRMVRTSETLGEEGAARWVQSTYPEAVPLKGWPPSGGPGLPYEFDQIWRVPGAGPEGADLFIVVEAKGASAQLGTRTVGAAIVEQGTPQYYEATLDAMAKAGKPGARELRNAAPGAIRYVKVKAAVSDTFGRHTVRDLVISDFEAP